ncbi:MAG: OmpA family protein [Labilithrix sp.]|nr:OmpA family protein [Labilithrix sp.]
MQNQNTTKVLLGSVIAFALGAVACGPTLPPKELVDARSAYTQSANGPAAAETPAQVHTAKTALDQAEQAFADDGDKPHVRDQAYIALRKAQLADANAQLQIAQKAKDAAEREAQALQADMLKRTQSDLVSSQQNLSKTQEQLDAERKARAEAERKHAQAMSDLQKIASVKQETRGMVITLSGSVLFATNEASLLPAAIVKLNEVADALVKGNPDANITVEGHTDSQGTRDYNVQLGQRRAEAVKAQLVSRGVASDRIKAVGVGPDRPVADNKSAEGRANNRRVEIVVEGSQGGAAPAAPGAGAETPSSATPRR